jgi:NADPH2:quinone reductase
MKALRFHHAGNVRDVLAVEDTPIPVPADGHALVRVHAAAVNPSDVKNVAGAFPETTLPRVPGRDFAGTVEAGNDAWKGMEVFGTAAHIGSESDGSHAEYVVVPEDALVRKPTSLTMVQAASVGVPYVTASEGLRRARLAAGHQLLIVGGTGAVGRAVAQIAKWSGARVIATTENMSLVDESASRDVDVWIDLSREKLEGGTRRATGGTGVDVAFNVVGGSTIAETLGALARGGRVVAISTPKDPNVTFDLRHFYHQQLELIGVDSLKLDDRSIVRLLQGLLPGFDAGALRVSVGAEVPLSEGPSAYLDVEAGKAGKRVLIP